MKFYFIHVHVLYMITSGGGGGSSILKVYKTDVWLESGILISSYQLYEWLSFSLQKFINGISFYWNLNVLYLKR